MGKYGNHYMALYNTILKSMLYRVQYFGTSFCLSGVGWLWNNGLQNVFLCEWALGGYGTMGCRTSSYASGRWVVMDQWDAEVVKIACYTPVN